MKKFLCIMLGTIALSAGSPNSYSLSNNRGSYNRWMASGIVRQSHLNRMNHIKHDNHGQNNKSFRSFSSVCDSNDKQEKIK